MIKQISEAEISLLLKKNKNKTKDEINIQTKYIFIGMQPGGWIYNDGKKKRNSTLIQNLLDILFSK